VLVKRRTESQIIRMLFDEKVSVRRGGRGQRDVALTADDQLLLAELLFDVCSTTQTTDIATWEIRLVGVSMTEHNIEKLQTSIRRLIPDAKFIGAWNGSVILRARSSRDSYRLLEQLHELDALPPLLEVDAVELTVVRGIDHASPVIGVRADGRLQALLASVNEWLPPGDDANFRELEASFAEYLGAELQSSVLAGANVYRDASVSDHPNDLQFDFLLSWPSQRGDEHERIAIELTQFRSLPSFINKVNDLMHLGRPVILVVCGVKGSSKRLDERIAKLSMLNANINVVLKRAQPHDGV
jgi:hypothetical protein